MKHKAIFCLVGLFLAGVSPLFAQSSANVNTDSLLHEAFASIQQENYSLAEKQAKLALAIAPDYLDYYLILGRVYASRNQADSARYCYNKVIKEIPDYEDAYIYWTNLEVQEEQWEEAGKLTDQGIALFPDQIWFYNKRALVYQQEGELEEEVAFLETVQPLFPDHSSFRQRINFLQGRLTSDRIGLQYSLTAFDRDGVGPWHLAGLQYIRERKWGSLIGRLSWAQRMSDGEVLLSGWQYEIESYIIMNDNNYSYADLALSADDVFPNYRIAYSWFHNYDKGWESELGGRLTGVGSNSTASTIFSGIAGVGKYVGNSWLNLRSSLNFQNDNLYPAFTATWRYYWDTRFDYFTLFGGYGTSPDERTVANQLEYRIALDSYRAGIGYYRLLGDHYQIGLQFMYNNQEYIEDNFQNEYESYLLLQYRF
ncbi:YaiO family outer membrane beta-barrel protein [Echinicola pacifica]|uniref:YaiO family outer membrane beta-barrel protein n=1 Tax=Echinicola pacifica TaxID=346377 RepID=UPI0005C5D443|nr:YaiO family outer membrane beta-barrel protein [Echinicola pacifica]